MLQEFVLSGAREAAEEVDAMKGPADTSRASSQVFSLALRAVPSPLLPQEPDAVSNPTTPSHYDTDLPPSSPQPSANQIP
jgi:hypothetical protein